MSSFSLSSVPPLLAAAAAAVCAGVASAALGMPAGRAWLLVPAAMALACIAAAAVAVVRVQTALARTAAVCAAALDGDLEARILGVPPPGEIGRLQRSLNAVLDIIDAFVREARGSLEHVAHGKYYRKVLPQGLPGAFHQAASILNGATESMRARVDAMAHVGAEASQDFAGVAVAVEEVSKAVQSIEQQVAVSAAMSHDAVEQAARARNLVGNVKEAARSVGAIVGLINEITSRTNLLALNATVEAVRAGQAGKGFAVVAGEIQKLAEQTERSTAEIVRQVEAMRAATDAAAATMAGIADSAGKLDEVSTAIAAAVHEQNAAAAEIARSTQSAAEKTQKVVGSLTSSGRAALA